MTNTISYFLVMAMAVTYILLGVESDSILQWFAFVFGGILSLALIRQIFTKEDSDA